MLDLLLPHRSGLEVLRAIRSEPRTRTLPVLILTARGTEMDKLVGFEHGADDYLTKPFSRRTRRSRQRDPSPDAGESDRAHEIGPLRPTGSGTRSS